MGALLKLLFISYFVAAAVPGSDGQPVDLITRSVGAVNGEVITSREVMINSFIEDSLYRKDKAKRIYKFDPTHSNFVQETQAVLLEMAIAQEGVRFPVAKVEDSEVRAQRRKFEASVGSNKNWKKLQVDEDELDKALRAKISAKKFIRFKVSSASLPITDQEALDYFKKNRFKFDKLPFENFKDNIKSFLNKRRVDARLREWFEVLQIKYSIENHLNEAGA